MRRPIYVLAVYTSAPGNTGKMARSVAGSVIACKEALAATRDDVRRCDALIPPDTLAVPQTSAPGAQKRP